MRVIGHLKDRLAAFTLVEPPEQAPELLRAPTTEVETVADLTR